MGVCSSEEGDRDDLDLAQEEEEAAREARGEEIDPGGTTVVLKVTEPYPGTTVEIRASATIGDLKRKLGRTYGIDDASADLLEIHHAGEAISADTRLDKTSLGQEAEIAVMSVKEAAIAAAAKVDMYKAAAGGQAKMLDIVFTHAPERFEEIGGDGRTVLWRATFQGEASVVEALVKAKADVNKAAKGTTPLLWASAHGHYEVVCALLGVADISQTSILGETPLQVASIFGHSNIVQTLLTRGADVHKADDSGCTPLHGAADNGHIDCVALLIAAKADVNTKDNNGETALDLADDGDVEEIQEMLRDAGAIEE